ncbi:hypothetical protein D3C72_2385090 [compost metagenome]
MSSERLVSAAFIESMTGPDCRISRETFSDRSLESTTPLMKRRYSGRNCSAWSMMKTRCT